MCIAEVMCVCSEHRRVSRAIDKFKLGSKTMQITSTNKHLKVRIYLTRLTRLSNEQFSVFS